MEYSGPRRPRRRRARENEIFAFRGTAWSMPMPPSSPHSSVTKWRSASQESKSIVNYVMLFLWAIICGSYLSLRRCRRSAPSYAGTGVQSCQWCSKKKNKRKRFGAAGVFLLWPVAKEALTSFKRAPGESCPLIAPRCWITAASHRHSGWKLQLNALNLM